MSAGLVALGLVGAAPAVAGALSGSGQPPPDAPAVRVRVIEPGPAAQPVNRHPVSPGAPTQVRGPSEQPGPPSYAGNRVDEGGVDGADRPGGRHD